MTRTESILQPAVWRYRCRRTLLAILAGAWLATGGAAMADEFKIENSVYSANQKEPTSLSITYYVGGAVYDFMKQPAEVVIFEKAANQFIIVNIAQRIRVELAGKEIAELMLQLQQSAAKNANPVVKFAAEPTFQERLDEASNELTLSSQWVTYRLVLEPEASQEVVEQYREFCDWNARLNALLKPGSLPPFARFEVDRAVAQRQAIASQVFLTLSSTTAGQPPVTIRSEHRLVRTLKPADLDRIKHLRGGLGGFKLVNFEQYRKERP